MLVSAFGEVEAVARAENVALPLDVVERIVAYVDSTISLPLLTAYCLSRVKPRKLKRLYDRRDGILQKVRSQYLKTGTVTKVLTSRKIAKRASSVGLNKTLDRDR